MGAKRGSGNGASKFTEETVIEARRMRLDGLSYSEIGRHFGIGHVGVMHAVKGKNWGHIPGALVNQIEQGKPDSKDRFFERTIPVPESGCWLWLGFLDPKGYGRTEIEYVELAHRRSWRLFNGWIPKDMLVCHKCDTPSCVNPNHLFLGTARDNVADRENKMRNRPLLGPDNHNTKLSEAQVLQILEDTRSNKLVASSYDVDPTTIANIRKGRTWRYLTGRGEPIKYRIKRPLTVIET